MMGKILLVNVLLEIYFSILIQRIYVLKKFFFLKPLIQWS